MKRESIKKGILYSVMWSIAYQLNNQIANEPSFKIKRILSYRYESYTDHQKYIFHKLRTEVWVHLEKRFDGDINLPILMTELFWSFPDVFGKKVQIWIDKMDDLIVSNLEYDELVSKSKDVSDWYVELMDKVIFDYMKGSK